MGVTKTSIQTQAQVLCPCSIHHLSHYEEEVTENMKTVITR